MRAIAHLSNLKIGWTAPAVLIALADTLHRLQPNVVVVSGNLSASGQATELRAARTFLDTVPSPQVVVPGDGDSVGHNRFSRLLSSGASFATIVEANTTPCFADREVVLVGLDSSKAAQIKHGGMDEQDGKRIDQLLKTADPKALRILVSFRPEFLQGEEGTRGPFDILLTGPKDTQDPQPAPTDPMLVFYAGDRPEGLSFNFLRVTPPEIVVEHYGWKDENAEFRLLASETLSLGEARFTA